MPSPVQVVLDTLRSGNQDLVTVSSISDPLRLSVSLESGDILIDMKTVVAFRPGATHQISDKLNAFLIDLLSQVEATAGSKMPDVALPDDGEATLTDREGNELVFQSEDHFLRVDGSIILPTALNDRTSRQFASVMKFAIFN